MKKALLLSIFVLLFVACEKDDSPRYSQEALNGTWEALEKTSNGCVARLIITSNSLSEVKICNGIPIKLDAEEYSFNGRIIKYKLLGIKMEFEISELTDQKLVLGVNTPLEYKRISQ